MYIHIGLKGAPISNTVGASVFRRPVLPRGGSKCTAKLGRAPNSQSPGCHVGDLQAVPGSLVLDRHAYANTNT